MMAPFNNLLSSLQKLVETLPQETTLQMQKRLKEIQEEWSKLARGKVLPTNEIKEHYQTLINTLQERHQEKVNDQEWQSWSNLQRLQQLCTKMLSLKDSPSASAAKKLMEEWKKVGATTLHQKREELWREFCSAKDFVDQTVLKEKKELVEELLRLISPLLERSVDQVTLEWAKEQRLDQMIQKIKQTQKKLQELGHLPFNLEKEIPPIREKVDAFFQKLGPYKDLKNRERESNLYHKQQLIHEAEKILRKGLSVENILENTAQINELMRQWKTFGPVQRQLQDQLWQKFNAAAQQIFDFFQQVKKDNAQKANTLIQQLESEGDISLNALEEEWRQLGPLPEREESELQNTWRLKLKATRERQKSEQKKLQNAKLEESENQRHLLRQFATVLFQDFNAENAEKAWERLLENWKKSDQHESKKAALHQLLQAEKNPPTKSPSKSRKDELCLQLDVLSRLVFTKENFGELPLEARLKQMSLAQKMKGELMNDSRGEKKFASILTQWGSASPHPTPNELWHQLGGLVQRFL